MTSKKNTRRALLSSVVALILCCSMLVGTTFAWFTDEVKSMNNVITAGNLDVDVVTADGESVHGKANLFNEISKWEPGVVAYETLTVENNGTLALKYQMTLNFTNATATAEGKTLVDVLKVGVIEGTVAAGATRDEVLADVAVWQDLETFALAGELAAGDDATPVTLVIYWAPNVLEDNDYNMNNGQTTVLSIDFGVHVFATQVEAEVDSFGPDYDGGTPWLSLADTSWYDDAEPGATEFTLTSAEDLAGFAALVNGTAGVTTFAANATAVDFADCTIKLGGNIDLNNQPWTPIGTWENCFSGTFDGQGYTISNLYVNDPAGEGVGLFAVVADGEIKNVTLENVNVSGYSMVAGVVGAAYPATFSNVHVTGDVNIVADWAYVAGISGYCYYGTQVDGCSVIANENGLIQSVNRNAVGGITAWLLEGNHSVTNCQVKNLDLVGWTNVGGITGFVHYNNTIDGCSVENVNLVKTRIDGNPGIGLIAGGWSYHASNAITLSNNTVKNATMTGTHIAYAAYNELYGSEYGGATTSNFVLENNTVENVTNNLMVVKAIKTLADLQTAVNNAQEGDVIAIAANITGDLTMPKNDVNFTIDGNGFTLNGSINLNGTANKTIKNICFDAAGAKRGYDYNGSAKQYANIITGDKTNNPLMGARNIVIDGCEFTGTFANGGAAISFADYYRKSGFSGDITIKNCTFDTENSYYDIYGHYTGNGVGGYGNFVIEGNTFKSERTQGISVYLGRYASSTPVVVKDNAFEAADSLENAVYVQDHSNYGVSVNAENNTFGG